MRKQFAWISWCALLAAFVMVFAGCSGGGNDEGQPSVGNPRLVITLDDTPITSLASLAGDTRQLKAVYYDSAGSVATPPSPVQWAVSTNALGAIDQNGLWAAAQVTVKVSGTITATVTGVQPASITASVVPASDLRSLQVVAPSGVDPTNIGRGSQLQLRAIATDVNNTQFDVTNMVAWSADAALGGANAISNTGLFVAPTLGTGQVTAAINGLTGSITLTVTTAAPLPRLVIVVPQGVNLGQVTAEQVIHFTAVLVAVNGTQTPATPTWTVSNANGNIAQDGTFTAQAAGSVTVTATQNGLSDSVQVTIGGGGPTYQLTIVAPQGVDLAHLVVGQAVHFTAVKVGSDGSEAAVTPTWSVTGTSGTIAQDGTFTAKTVGASTVAADLNGLHAQQAVNVAALFSGTIAFTKKGFYSNLVALTNDGTLHTLTSGNNTYRDPAWNPAAAQLAFTASGAPLNGICTMNPDGTGAKVLYNVSAQDVAWSPDGCLLAYTSGAIMAGEISIIDKNGLFVKKLAVGLAGIPSNPVWSPDGKWLAFAVMTGVSVSDGVYLVNYDDPTKITRIFSGHPLGIAWKPGSQTLAVSDYKTVTLITTTGAELSHFTETGEVTGLAWSPDGSKLVYSEQSGAFPQLVLRDLATGARMQLTAFADASALEPTWK